MRTSEGAGPRPRVCSSILSFLVFPPTPSQPHRLQGHVPPSTAVTFDLVHTYQGFFFVFCFVFPLLLTYAASDSRLLGSLKRRFWKKVSREIQSALQETSFSWLVPFCLTSSSLCLFLGFCLLSHSRDTAGRRTKVVPVLTFIAQNPVIVFPCFDNCM